MATQAWLAQGSLLQMDDGLGNFFTIQELLTLKGPTRKRAIVDVTNHNSANQTREYINGLIDPGSFQFTANWIMDSSQGDLAGWASVFNSGVRRNFQVLLSNPAGNVIHTTGLAISDDTDLPVDKQATFAGEVKMTGPRSVT
jgi:hypothetical protein